MNRYEDILHHPHHVSETRPRMSGLGRAAQFAPFAALTGYDALIRETARLTDARLELTEEEQEALDKRLQMIAETITERPEVTITYFKPDARKAGGAYITVSGTVKKIDVYERRILLDNGLQIPVGEVYEIQGALFR